MLGFDNFWWPGILSGEAELDLFQINSRCSVPKLPYGFGKKITCSNATTRAKNGFCLHLWPFLCDFCCLCGSFSCKPTVWFSRSGDPVGCFLIICMKWFIKLLTVYLFPIRRSDSMVIFRNNQLQLVGVRNFQSLFLVISFNEIKRILTYSF